MVVACAALFGLPVDVLLDDARDLPPESDPAGASTARAAELAQLGPVSRHARQTPAERHAEFMGHVQAHLAAHPGDLAALQEAIRKAAPGAAQMAESIQQGLTLLDPAKLQATLDAMRAQLAAIQSQLDKLTPPAKK
jgi:hypothetical protein